MKHRILPEPPQPNPHLRREIGMILVVALLGALLVLGRFHTPLTGNAINASVGTTANITDSTPFNCSYALSPGTNLVSFPCITIVMDRDDLFANFSANGSNVQVMYKYTPTTNGKWEVYNASLPSYVVQTLDDVSRADGLYLVMGAPENFTHEGFLAGTTTIGLRTGWNLVGYPSNTTTPLNTSLAGVSWTVIKTLEGTEESGGYLYGYPNGSGNLTNTSPYHGYWLNSTAVQSWGVTG